MSCCGTNELPARLDQPVYEPKSLRGTHSPGIHGSEIVKIVVLGNASVGKTSLLRRLTEDSYSNAYKSTIGADFVSKTMTVNDRSFTLQIWDTAGQERFHSISSIFYRGSHACALVFDVSQRSSLQALKVWRERFHNSVPADEWPSIPFLVIANKTDLDETTEWQVTRQDIQQYCKKELDLDNVVFASAASGSNVHEAFHQLLEKVLILNDDFE